MSKRFKPENMGRLDNEKRRQIIPPDRVLDRLNIREGDTFLDIGAGLGYFALPAIEYVGTKGRVIAADISEEMLAELRRRMQVDVQNFDFILTDGRDIPLPDSMADIVFMAFVLHEFDDSKAYLTEADRVLKEDGRIVILEWDIVPSDMGPPMDHRLSYEDVVNLAEASGFSEHERFQVNEIQFMAVLKKKAYA